MPRKAGDAETSMFTRGRIIGMYEGGVPKMMISKKLNIDPKTIRKWILRYEAQGENGLKSIPKPGAHRKTTVFEDVAIAQAVAVTPTISAQEINKMLGLNISAHTIRRRVRDAKVRSKQERKEGRLKKKSKMHQPGMSGQTSMTGECSPKRKVLGVNKKVKKKLMPVMTNQMQMGEQQTQTSQPQMPPQDLKPIQQPDLSKQNLAPVPILENGVHQQYILKPEMMQPANLANETHNVQMTQTHQYQPKQMPFYGFSHTSGYEFARIWTPMTNRGFGPAEVTQVTHSSVQTTGFLNPTVSSPN